MEEVTFKIKISSDWFRLPPHVKIWLDNELIEDTEIFERKSDNDGRIISFKRDLSDGNHDLKIEYLGKETPDTRVDNDGNISADHLIHIEEVEIDEIELGFLAYRNGTFYPDRTDYPELEESMKMTDIGYNGVWTLNFEVPTYIWFLENL